MEYDNEKVLKLIYPEGVPANLENDELLQYLSKLGSYKSDQLRKEVNRLVEENKTVVEQTQDLAISNYKTFILTSECSREIFREFRETEHKLDGLIEKLPKFFNVCEEFVKKSDDINTSRQLNIVTMKRHSDLIDILKLPQLMDTCIRVGKYEDALELASYVQRMGVKHSNIPLIKSIATAIEDSWHTMLSQLLAQLRTDMQLPKCLQVIGYLRRMQAFSTSELKLKFLQARDSWFTGILASIPQNDPQQHLTKTIELTRIHLFNIITQYRAIFTEDDDLFTGNDSRDSSKIFHGWLHEKIEAFLLTLEDDLLRGVNSVDTVLGQCMYFGLSFSRVGADFRGLLAPIFVRTIGQHFQNSVGIVTRQYEQDIESYTLINKISTGLNRGKSTSLDTLSPPDSLLDFHPLATYCNGLLGAFNELRLCAPLGVADTVAKTIQSSMERVSKAIFIFYRQEQQAFSEAERDNFIRLCSCLAYDLIPYIQKCIHCLFPPHTVAQHLGINVQMLQKASLTYLVPSDILKPLHHLLPNRVDAIIMQSGMESVAVN
ncbi:conserved oligomeric Golgi complex subunit 8 [Lutzomyia longipalpis]|uniref:conserved oligomeric Golgi complex subunit 8 n=1 Tax=Lutzomyia longipalpis TaxID=7200 RepID=UPI002483A6DF|nr:conserved oligomeric Golgi complex subunit 8 [Lutzomyia longipalpis]